MTRSNSDYSNFNNSNTKHQRNSDSISPAPSSGESDVAVSSIDKCGIYGTMILGKKKLIIDKRADKELKKCSRSARLKLKAIFNTLSEHGFLKFPVAKKLTGHQNLFEIRIRKDKNWRVIYAYISQHEVVILSAFIKKTQKTPQKELWKARRRFIKYRSNYE